MNLSRFPLLVFVGLVVILAIGLTLDPKQIPSPLIDKPAPELQLPYLDDPQMTFDTRKMNGQVWILNVWASWCNSCRAEHNQIRRHLTGEQAVVLVGMNYKDKAAAAEAWLGKHGNPYDYTLRDGQGQAGLEWGVYAVPETFVIDQQGIIRYKHIGPLQEEDIRKTMLPLLRRLQGESV